MLQYVPNHQRWYAKRKPGWNVYKSHTRFCTFGTNLHAQSVLTDKISASELRRSAWLVGYARSSTTFQKLCFLIPPNTHTHTHTHTGPNLIWEKGKGVGGGGNRACVMNCPSPPPPPPPPPPPEAPSASDTTHLLLLLSPPRPTLSHAPAPAPAPATTVGFCSNPRVSLSEH